MLVIILIDTNRTIPKIARMNNRLLHAACRVEGVDDTVEVALSGIEVIMYYDDDEA